MRDVITHCQKKRETQTKIQAQLHTNRQRQTHHCKHIKKRDDRATDA